MTGYIAESMQQPVAPATALWFLVIVCALCFVWGFVAERRRKP